MADRGQYYTDVYMKGAYEHFDQIIADVRESAEASNKSLSERRKELAKYLEDVDRQIGQAQTALERLDTTHFDAHMKQATDADRRRLASQRAGSRVTSELDSLREKARKTAAAAIGNAEGELAVVQAIEELKKAETPQARADALQKIANKASVLGLLGSENIVFGQSPPTTPEEIARVQAMAIGLQEGLVVGVSQFEGVPADQGLQAASNRAAQLMTGVVPNPRNLARNANAASANVVRRASSSSGGLTPESIDAMLVESGLASDIMTRQADIKTLSEERQRIATEQARLGPEMTEDDIMREALQRQGSVGSSAELGPGIIGSFRRRKQALENLQATRALAEKNQGMRDMISSLSPEQQVMLQATARANAAFRRDPNAFTGASQEVQDIADQLINALKKDPSLQGDQTRLVEMALQLAGQANPEGTPEQIQKTRDEILQSFAYKHYRTQKARGNRELAERQPDAPEVGDRAIQAAEEMGEINPALSAYLQTFNKEEARELVNQADERDTQALNELLGAVETDEQVLQGPLLPDGTMYPTPQEQPLQGDPLSKRPALQALLADLPEEEAALIRERLLAEEAAASEPAPAPAPAPARPAPQPEAPRSVASAWQALSPAAQQEILSKPNGYVNWFNSQQSAPAPEPETAPELNVGQAWMALSQQERDRIMSQPNGYMNWQAAQEQAMASR